MGKRAQKWQRKAKGAVKVLGEHAKQEEAETARYFRRDVLAMLVLKLSKALEGMNVEDLAAQVVAETKAAAEKAGVTAAQAGAIASAAGQAGSVSATQLLEKVGNAAECVMWTRLATQELIAFGGLPRAVMSAKEPGTKFTAVLEHLCYLANFGACGSAALSNVGRELGVVDVLKGQYGYIFPPLFAGLTVSTIMDLGFGYTSGRYSNSADVVVAVTQSPLFFGLLTAATTCLGKIAADYIPANPMLAAGLFGGALVAGEVWDKRSLVNVGLSKALPSLFGRGAAVVTKNEQNTQAGVESRPLLGDTYVVDDDALYAEGEYGPRPLMQAAPGRVCN